MLENIAKNIEKYIKELVYKEELTTLDYIQLKESCRYLRKVKFNAWNGSYCKQFLHK